MPSRRNTCRDLPSCQKNISRFVPRVRAPCPRNWLVDRRSKSMARNCSAEAVQRGVQAAYVDLGVTENNAHTTFSSDPKRAAQNAFLDFLLLLDAAVVVRTASSFSGMAVAMKGLVCSVASMPAETPVDNVYVCVPRTGC